MDVGDNGVNRRPLYRFAFEDADDTRLYISSVTGEVVVWNTREQRFWNWLGAIPHWLYFTELRRDVQLWGQVIIWTSLLGTFLTVIGLYLGIARFRTGRDGRLSPYYGWFYWHHLTGLVFGIVTLTWVLSGLFSMQPWGFLESQPATSAKRSRARIRNGAKSKPRSTRSAMKRRPISSACERRHSAEICSGSPRIRMAASRVSMIAAIPRRPRKRISRRPRSFSPANAPIASAEILQAEDAYYFRFQAGFAERDPLALPVYRIALNDAEATRYYLYPATGQLLLRVDAADAAFAGCSTASTAGTSPRR